MIGVSGFYAIEALDRAEWRRVATPWGEPSDELLFGRVGDVEFRSRPRHGRGHRIPPGEADARANIDVLKRAGCTDLLAIPSVGSLGEELAPGRFAVVDPTVSRLSSFLGTGMTSMPEARLEALAGRALRR